MDPLKAIEEKLDEIKTEVRIAVETAILRETVRGILSRLITLDTNRADTYRLAITSIGEQ